MFADTCRQLRASFPPKPTFTEANLPDLAGKVYIVTGANTGIGKELARLLHAKNARVYVAGRSEQKCTAAIADISAANPASSGSLVFLPLDLADLSTIKASADRFIAAEKRLDVLFSNAGVMMPPQGSKTAQGHELQLGVNCLGTFLFTKFLVPILTSTAAAAPKGAVRVVWVSSLVAEAMSPKPYGVPLDNLDYHVDCSARYKYSVSKAGNYLHSCEFARRFADTGIVSVAVNPGNLRTELNRHLPGVVGVIMYLMLYPAINGAYTELFAGLSPDVADKNGAWVAPFGRLETIRADLIAATKPESEGGSGVGKKFWEWSEEKVKEFL